MNLRRPLSLLAALALLAPLALAAWPACEMEEPCPMAGAGAAPACHGSSIQASDCCFAAPAAVEIGRAALALAPEIAPAATTPARVPAVAGAGPMDPAPAAAPLYTLFRALLI